MYRTRCAIHCVCGRGSCIAINTFRLLCNFLLVPHPSPVVSHDTLYKKEHFI